MAHWLTCVLTGRHSYSPWCENGAMFLRCTNCGRRSTGWQVAGPPPLSGRRDAEAGSRPRPVAHIVARLSIVNGE